MFPWGWLNVGIPSVLFDASSKLKLWLNQCNISNAERKDWHKLWYRLSSFPEDELQTTRGESIISPLVPPSAQNFTLFNPLFYERPRNNSSPSYLISSALIGRSCMWTHKAMMVNMLNTTCTKVSMFALSLWACHRAHISIYFKALLCTGSQSCSRGCRLFVLLCVWEISWLLASWLSLRLSWEIFLSNISVCCLEGIVPLSIFLFFFMDWGCFPRWCWNGSRLSQTEFIPRGIFCGFLKRDAVHIACLWNKSRQRSSLSQWFSETIVAPFQNST